MKTREAPADDQVDGPGMFKGVGGAMHEMDAAGDYHGLGMELLNDGRC